MLDKRNVLDKFKGWTEDLIRDEISKEVFPYAVLMENLIGDFNIGTVIRSANALGASKVYYTGNRKWDRRGAVGAHNYTMVEYVEDISVLRNDYSLIGLENCEGSNDMRKFKWPKKSLMIVGEEGRGLSDGILELCDHVVSIPQFGSVRSFNAATASSIAMYDYVTKFKK